MGSKSELKEILKQYGSFPSFIQKIELAKLCERRTRCCECGRRLKIETTTYLELSATDGKFYNNEKHIIPSDHESQGKFAFGPDCAKKLIEIDH